jgi:hypothetical protein
MRTALNLSREALARRLGTTPAIVDSLEAGAITTMPRWPETNRIVRAYCGLLQFDPEPVLWRIQSQLQAVSSSPSKAARPITTAPKIERTRASQARTSEPPYSGPRRRRRARTFFALSAPVALAAVLVYLAQSAPGRAYAALTLLPQPVAMPLRAGLDYMLFLTAPRRDGLTWIEVGDPRMRKADKLRTGER